MWDGDPTTFTEFAEMAGHWQQSVAYHKRYLCGPKLQAELSGSARRFVMSMAPGWISFDGGVDRLLNHLRMHLGQPQLSEMSDYMARYFKMSKRKRHETMNEYITRKAELYMRTCQSLDRVQQRYEPEKSKHGSSTNASSRPPSRPGLTQDLPRTSSTPWMETMTLRSPTTERTSSRMRRIHGRSGRRNPPSGGNPRIGTQGVGGKIHGRIRPAATMCLRRPMARTWICFPVLFRDGFSSKMLASTPMNEIWS